MMTCSATTDLGRTMDDLILSKDVVVMASEPTPDCTPDELRAWYEEHNSEKDLATAYAAASNEFWWVEDNEYDYERGTKEYQEACRITDSWGELMNELLQKIFGILRSEGVTIPESGYITVLTPFMERNGFYDGQGWWISNK